MVIGAGLAGCATAWHLATRRGSGAGILLLEQNDAPGAEATAQNAGMVRRLGEDPAERALAMRTHAFLCAVEDAEQQGHAAHAARGPGPGPGHGDWRGLALSRRTGALLGLSHDPHHLNDAVAHLRGHGVPVEQLDAAAAAARVPALAGAPLQRAWWLPEERVADPHALMTGYLRGLRRMGVAVRCGVQVTALRTAAGDAGAAARRVVGVDTAQGPVEAAQVVLAAGAWSALIARESGLQRPLFPLRRAVFTTAPHPLSAPDMPWCWIDDEGIYVRPEVGGFLLSACDEHLDPPRAGGGSRGTPSLEARALAMAKLQRALPALADLQPTGGWTGLRTFASDRCPMLGPDPELGGLWWAAGLGGFGVTCNYAIGEAVAAWMTGDEVPWLHQESVAPGRHLLRRFPIRPGGQLHRPRLLDARRVPMR